MRVELIGHFKPCMTEISLHIGARMADYIRTNPYSLLITATGRDVWLILSRHRGTSA